MTASITETLDHVAAVLADAVDRRPGGRHLPRQPPDLHRRGDLRAGDEAHLRGQLGLPGPREPDPQHRRLLHHLHRPQPVVITRDKDGELHCLINACAHRGAMLCRRKTDNRTTLHLPVPRLDVQQRRQAAEGQGPATAPATRSTSTPNGSHDLTKVARFEQLPRLPVRQPQRRRAAARRAPRRRHQGHRHDRRPVAGRAGGAARLLHLHLRRQLEGAGRERRRRLPRHLGALELRRHHRAGAAPASRPTTPRPWTPAAGASPGGGYYAFEHGHLLLWTNGRNPRGPAAVGPARRARASSSARPRPTSWSTARATCACTRTST